MFENVGSKLKAVASVFFIIAIIGILIIGVYLLAMGAKYSSGVMVLASFLYTGIFIFFSWIFSAIIYGIGEAADNSAAIRKMLVSGKGIGTLNGDKLINNLTDKESKKESKEDGKDEEIADEISEKTKKLKVKMSNSYLPFVPDEVNIKSAGADGTISLVVFMESRVENLAIKCDVVLHSIFDDTVVIPDVTFVNFSQETQGFYMSDNHKYFGVMVDPGNIVSCDINIKKITNLQSIVAVNETLNPMYDVSGVLKQLHENRELDAKELITEAGKLKNAAEVFEMLKKSGAPAELTEKIKSFVDSERIYGNMHNSSIHEIKRYYKLEDLKIEKINASAEEPVMEEPHVDESPLDEPDDDLPVYDISSFCTHCGTKIPEGSNFCIKCGNPV